MVLLLEKLGLSPKVTSKLEHFDSNSGSDAHLGVFRSKIADSIAQALLKSDPGERSGLLSLMGFRKCFQLIELTDRALAKLVVEIEYPMNRWGGKASEEYLSYSLNLLDILNSISSSLTHLTQARMSILHSLTQNSHKGKALEMVPGKRLGKDYFKFEGSMRIEDRPAGSEKEIVLLRALRVSKKIEFLALGFMQSGLCSDPKPYLEIRKLFGGFKDSATEGLDSRFYKELTGIQQGVIFMEDVREVNSSIDRISVEEVKARLKVLENSIQGLEKQANNMFYQVLERRNGFLDNVRLTGQNGST